APRSAKPRWWTNAGVPQVADEWVVVGDDVRHARTYDSMRWSAPRSSVYAYLLDTAETAPIVSSPRCRSASPHSLAAVPMHRINRLAVLVSTILIVAACAKKEEPAKDTAAAMSPAPAPTAAAPTI